MLTIADDEGALAREAAERLTGHVERTIAARGAAVVSLTGGGTPRRLYALLGDEAHPWRARIDWSRLHLFWGDERHVPPDHPDSNFGMAHEALIRHVPIPAERVYRMRGELADAREAAREYETALDRGFAAAGRSDRTFDVMLLGLGEDAHIASIFPGSQWLARRPVNGRPAADDAGQAVTDGQDDVRRAFMARQHRVAAVWAPHLDAWRITLTPAALLDAQRILLLVAGARKAAAVHAAREGPRDADRWPAQILREAGDRVEWLVDRDAASRLTP
jgi:6-phosphogluconolactonase